MALARAAKQVLSTSNFAQMLSVRSMSNGGLKGFNEREKTIEDMYFTAEDKRLFAKLLNKVKVQADAVDQHASAGVKAAELSALKAIVEKYKISSEDVEALLNWKHTHY